MRYYTTKLANDGITFTCIYCPHSVATLDFDYEKGNRRTQAAAAINQHVKQGHASKVRIGAPRGQMAVKGFEVRIKATG